MVPGVTDCKHIITLSILKLTFIYKILCILFIILDFEQKFFDNFAFIFVHLPISKSVANKFF